MLTWRTSSWLALGSFSESGVSSLTYTPRAAAASTGAMRRNHLRTILGA